MLYVCGIPEMLYVCGIPEMLYVCGIPEMLYVDNGSDVIPEQIEQACIALKIRLVHSRPGRPRGRWPRSSGCSAP